MSDVWISGGGLVCSVGYDLRAATVAMRAGIARITQLPYVDNAHRPIVGAMVGALPPQLPYRDRLVALLCRAIEDCLEHTPFVPARTPLLIVTASDRRPGVALRAPGPELLERVSAALGCAFGPGSEVLPRDEVGAAVALERAAEIVARGGVDGVVVAAVDSFVNAHALLWLADHGRLKTEDNADGVIPGEAAACALVTARPASSGAASVLGWGVGHETATVLDDEPCRAEGLTSAARAALLTAGLSLADVDARVSDLAGESYAFREQSLLVSRLLRQRKDRLPLWHPAELVGHVGAASGVLGWLFAREALRAGDATGPRALCCTGSAWGERAVVVLETARAKTAGEDALTLKGRLAL